MRSRRMEGLGSRPNSSLQCCRSSLRSIAGNCAKNPATACFLLGLALAVLVTDLPLSGHVHSRSACQRSQANFLAEKLPNLLLKAGLEKKVLNVSNASRSAIKSL